MQFTVIGKRIMFTSSYVMFSIGYMCQMHVVFVSDLCKNDKSKGCPVYKYLGECLNVHFAITSICIHTYKFSLI